MATANAKTPTSPPLPTMTFPELEAALLEAAAVLEPAGLLLVVTTMVGTDVVTELV